MYNPYTAYRVTGTWEDHASYSEGGTDYPLGYGTPLYAPASGRLVNNGWVGSAGRRATLYLDTPVARAVPASTTVMYGGTREGTGNMHAIVFQHAKGYLGDGHYYQGDLIGFSGASANGVNYGGDVHLHTHGLDAGGSRVDWLKFQGSAVAAVDQTPILEEDEMIWDVLQAISASNAPDGKGRPWLIVAPGYVRPITAAHWPTIQKRLKVNVIPAAAAEYDIIRANALQGTTADDI